ncbi:MAG: exo-alpha-sialidase [Planctomycetota bacterium]|nr:MAG: exo-alpha-sialidase [Planctomycetota bacterium]
MGTHDPTMRKLPFCLLAMALSAPAASAQNPRATSFAGDPGGLPNGHSVASDGDLSVSLFHDGVSEAIVLNVSDGRGIQWGNTVRVDDASSPQAKFVMGDSVAVASQKVYAYWRDRRNPPSLTEDLFFQFSANGGQSFQPADLQIHKGLPAGGNDIKDVCMAVDPRDPANGNDDLIAFLIAVEDDTTLNESLYLNYSIDGGANFLATALAATTHNGIADVDNIDLAVDGGKIYALWRDNSLNGVDDHVFLSVYDAVNGLFTLQDLQLDPATGLTFEADDGLSIAVSGGKVAAAWQCDLIVGGGSEVLIVNYSGNGGLTWTGDQVVGGYTPSVHDVDQPDVAVAANGTPVVVWEDNRLGQDQVYALHSLDNGATWTGERQLSTGVGSSPEVRAGADGTVAAAWGAAVSPNYAEAALSVDAGVTWQNPVTLSSNTGDVDEVRLCRNDAYGNYIAAWLADDFVLNDVFAGGFRPQSLTAVGDFGTPGAMVSFDVSLWPVPDEGKQFGVLISGASGAFVLPNGLNSGLDNTHPVFALALSNIPGVLSGTISGGSGSTPTFPIPAHAGPLYCTAVAFNSFTDLGAVTDLVLTP